MAGSMPGWEAHRSRLPMDAHDVTAIARPRLFLTRVAEVQALGLLRHYEALLDDSEFVRVRRLVFERHRQRFLITRALVRTTLAAQLGCSADELAFAVGPQGKPTLVGGGPQFNIAHTDDCVVLALGGAHAVGVDVESPGTVAPLDVADHLFAPGERMALNRLPVAARHRRFYELWTLKESLLKARGDGFAGGLDGCEFDLDQPGRVWRVASRSIMAGEQAWSFLQLQTPEGDIIALCSAAARMADPVCVHAVPLLGQSPADLHVTRRG